MRERRQPFVFVHGVRTSSAIWEPQVAAMTDLGHPCVTVDLPGHGSRIDEKFTLDSTFAAIEEGVRQASAPPLLVGLSLGGYASLAYAAGNAGRVAGVVLAGCSTEIRGWPIGAYRRISHPVARALRRSTQWQVVTDMLAALGGYSSLADLRRLAVPVWLVNGRWDILRFGERRLVSANPGLRLAVVRRAGHDVNTHAPVAFTRILLTVVHEIEAVLAGVQKLSPAI